MKRNWVLLALICVLLFGGFSSVSATPPASEYIIYSFSGFLNFVFAHFLVQILSKFQTFNYIVTTFAEIVTGVVSNVVSVLVKWLWSLKSTTKTGTDLLLSLHFVFLALFWVLFIWGLEIFLCIVNVDMRKMELLNDWSTCGV
jgi:hypothetical protein